MPTPVGPLGPDEIDPNDPDLWDWEDRSPAGNGRAGWIRAVAIVVVVVFGLLTIASLFR